MRTRKVYLPAIIVLLASGLFTFSLWFGTAQSAQAQGVTHWPTHYFAPYSFTPSRQADLVALSQKTGTKFYTLAFIINHPKSTCQASWNGIQPIGSWMKSSISALQAAGGDVSVSFGGASGKEIADSCTTVASLQAQYQSLISTYNLTHLDFDIEGKTLLNKQGNDRRNKAIAALQAHQKLVVSYTLSVDITGLAPESVSLLQNAIQNGVNISVINIMVMDYYNKNAPGNQMAKNAIKSANSLIQQLKTLYPAKSSSELWAMVGLTPMIGMNDDKKEVFTLKDAQTILRFAQQQNIPLLSFWEVQRDRQCAKGEPPPNNCTGVKQKPYQYDQTWAPFNS